MERTEFSVSVIIPVYNTEKYLSDAVESAVHLFEIGEVILVDDGSSDGSLALCFNLARTYSKVKVLQHPDKRNHGVAASRNLGIKAARFHFIAFLDADDYYLPNRFLRDKEIFYTRSEVDGVYGCNEAVFENDEVKKRFLEHYESARTTLVEAIPPGQLFRALLFGGFGFFHTSAITLRKAALEKTGLFNPKLHMGEDTELWLKLALKAILVAGSIQEPVAIRRVHGSNSIHDLEKLAYFRPRLYQSLFDWSLHQSFRFDIKNCFFIGLHRFGEGSAYSVKKLFWTQAVRKPRMVISLFFYKKIHQLYFS